MTESHPSRSISIEDIARYPLPGMTIPGNLTFSPDDRLIAYLFSPEGDLVRQLYAFDPSTGENRLLVQAPGAGLTEENVSQEEALRRERARQRQLGITQYSWGKGSRLLVPSGSDLFACDVPGAALRKLATGGEQPVQDARFSPDGERVAYVLDREVYVVPFSGGEPRQLTHGGRETGRVHGLAEYIAQEEMDRFDGYWWSPDSRQIAFTEVDESHIPVYRIVHQGKDFPMGEYFSSGEYFSPGIIQEDHHYPFAGGTNAHVRLGVIGLDGGEPVWMDLGSERDIYLARVKWMPDGRLAAQIENRSQTQLELIAFDPATGSGTKLLAEESHIWINLNNLFWPLEQPVDSKAGAFLWGSERSGFQHLYLYDGRGRLIRQLTSGKWMVDAIAGVDEAQGIVYFTGTLGDPRQRHLYAVPFTGGEPRQITRQPGLHTPPEVFEPRRYAPILDHACRRFIETFNAVDHPPEVRLCSLVDGAVIARLPSRPDPRLEQMPLDPPELVELDNRHGERLYGAVFRPPAEFGPGPYPTVVYVYGGPHKQMVENGWELAASMRPQYLRSQGFLVFVLDNHGSARRGLKFESAIYHDLGHIEVEDQQDGVRWLVQQGLADPQRVGVYGWSYGGYMAAMCLARAPETFQAAVAGAPVTHWDGYDTHYTERYMSTPQSNPDGYEVGSVMAHVQDMRGDLMIVHGLIDENVHFRHSARLINALIAARKPYELLLFPDERHMPRKFADRVFMEERIHQFLKDRLYHRQS